MGTLLKGGGRLKLMLETISGASGCFGNVFWCLLPLIDFWQLVLVWRDI